MDFSLKVGCKINFIIGIVILFISLFMDWYFFQATDSAGNVVILWTYHLLYDWQTNLPANTFINEIYCPQNTTVPLVIPIMMIVSLIIGAYGVLVNDIEKKEDFSTLKKYAYANFMILVLNVFFILIFPLYYIISNGLYYPFMNFNDIDLGVQFTYCIGTGYVMQLVAFTLIFPYTIFYYETIHTFEKSLYSPEIYIQKKLEKIKEPLDLDKFIAEEKLIQEKVTKHSSQKIIKSNEIDKIYNKFLEARGVK